MRLLMARPKGEGAFALAKLKVYSRGNINLPKIFLATLGVENGGEIIAEANPLKGEVILRRKPKFTNLPPTDLTNFNREEAYILRGAHREAEEFFKELAEGIEAVYPNAPVEIGTLENGVVYLKLGPREVFEEIHLSYWETPYYPRGIITLDGGVPRKTETGPEPNEVVEENLNLIRRYVNGQIIGKTGVKLIEAPRFTRSEAFQIGTVLKDLLRELLQQQVA
jgi:bifunctional DNA-binding transcriptional regulator/antitoxin component of YhaV-PrlF toxin-antitoxin module